MSLRHRRVLLNFAAQLVAQAINKLSPIVVYSIAQSRLTTGPFGHALFAISLIDWTSPFIDGGTNSYAQVEVGAKKDDRVEMSHLLGRIYLVRLINMIIALLVLFVAVRGWYVDYASTVFAISFLAISTVCDSTFVAMGLQRLWTISFATIVAKVITLVAVVLAVRSPEDFQAFAVIMVGGNFIVALVSFVLAIRYVRPTLISFQSILWTYRKVAPFAAMVVLYYGIEKYDYIVAEHFVDSERFGLYGGASRLAVALQSLVPALVMAFGSEILSLKEREALSSQVHLALGVVLALIFPLACGAWFLGGPILKFLYDDTFVSVAPVFAVLTATAIPQVIIVLLGFYLQQSHGMTGRFSRALLLGLIVGCLSGVLLGKTFGLMGVACSALIGKIVAAVDIWWNSRSLIVGGMGRHWRTSLLATAAMAGILAVFGGRGLFVDLLIGVAGYSVASVALNRGLMYRVWQKLRPLSA